MGEKLKIFSAKRHLQKRSFLKKGQWCLVLIILFVPSVLMAQYEDLFLITEHANSLLHILRDGTLFRFYENTYSLSMSGGYLTDVGVRGSALYNVIVYFIIAIWMLPVKLVELLCGKSVELGILVLWNKGLLVTVGIFSAIELEHISEYFGAERKDESFWFWICSPMLIFVSLLFGQVDILVAFLEIISLKLYLNRKYWSFSGVMAVAFCIKGFAVFMYIPMLLLVKKNVRQIFLHLLLFSWCQVLTFLCFMNTKSYQLITKEMDGIFGFSKRLFYSTLNLGRSEIFLLPAFFIILCILCYLIRPNMDDLSRYSVFIPLCSYTGFILFVSWNPQWTVLILPFLALSLCFMKERKAFYYVDILFEVSLIVTCCVNFRGNVDDAMINNGFLGLIFQRTYNGGYLGRLYDFLGLPQQLPFSALTAALISLVYIVYRNMFKENLETDQTCSSFCFNIARYSVIVLFLLASFFLWMVKGNHLY